MRRVIAAVVALLAIAAGLLAYQWYPTEKPKALVYEPPRALSPFSLEGTFKDQVTNDDLKGQWTLLFTGYTYCPDVCPTTLAQLTSIIPQLALQTETPIKVWMISVDPQRDTVDRLKEYTSYFGKHVEGVRADHKALYPFVRELGLMYSIPDPDATDYLVNHSGAIILVNPEGKRVAIFNPHPQEGELPIVNMDQLINDFGLIVNR
ncbi:SCO family protein [Idiomarina tyrosinivorans]|uniref:SCO family protein n=1 Tax=Idiomarina tyrosinivorans TaxID=1445662 RepID=A0A432ZTK1_9GAMM|nr:SCO family protein [Idiomarina tyrosinivorans]RUO81148.1 SCO family protein [Idiomarina tyrosinivorans]